MAVDDCLHLPADVFGRVTEPSPTAADLDRLDRAESALYADLISNAYAPPVRPEQERISFSAIEQAVVGPTTVMPGTYGQKKRAAVVWYGPGWLGSSPEEFSQDCDAPLGHWFIWVEIRADLQSFVG